MPANSVPETFATFLGVNLRQERTDIADEDLAKAINADLHTEHGTPRVRNGRTKLFLSQLDISPVRRLAFINNTRVHIAGRNAYVDEVKVIDGELSPSGVTTLMAFRPLNDSNEYAFVADAQVMKKIQGTTVTKWGIAAPTVAPVISIENAGTGALSGRYSVRYTYVREDDGKVAHESNPSPTSQLVEPSSADIRISSVTASTDAQVTHIYFYRTVAGGTQHKFELKIPIISRTGITYPFETNHTDDDTRLFTEEATSLRSGELNGEVFQVTYTWEKDLLRLLSTSPASTVATHEFGSGGDTTLSTLDAGLGPIVEVDNDVPPNATWATEALGYTFLVGDAVNPHYLWFSKRFRPESVPNFIEIGNPSDPLVSACPLRDGLAVFTRRTKYKVIGEPFVGMAPQQASSARGTPAETALLATELGVVMVARDGVFLTDVTAPDTLISQDIQPVFEGKTSNGYPPIDFNQSDRMATAFHNERLYVAYHAIDGTDWVAVFSGLTNKWTFYQYPGGKAVRSLLVEHDTNMLIAGGEDGFVYHLDNDNGAGDDGTDISMEVETKNFPSEDSGRRKLYQHYRVDLNTVGEDVESVFVVGETSKLADVLNDNRKKPILPLPGSCMGFSWRVEVSYTGKKKPRMYGVSAMHQPMETA